MFTMHATRSFPAIFLLTYLFLLVVAGEERQFLAEDLLLIQNLLVVDVLQQVRIFDAVGLEELGIRHLKGLSDRLRYQLSLQTNKTNDKMMTYIRHMTRAFHYVDLFLQSAQFGCSNKIPQYPATV